MVHIDGNRYSTVTDIDGTYTFAKLPAGKHNLSVSYIGFAPFNMDLAVNSSGSLSREKVRPVEGTVFVSGNPGYSVLGASKSNLTLSMIDGEGNIIHQVTRTK